jgi:hypothetical protein
MNDRIPMFPTAQPPRADEDTAAIEQVIEQVPGEIELDKIIKAQTSAPQIVKRMVELENSMWSLVGILLLLPQTTRDKIGATEAIEQARSLLLRSMVMDHNLEIPAAKKTEWRRRFNVTPASCRLFDASAPCLYAVASAPLSHGVIPSEAIFADEGPAVVLWFATIN